MYIPSQRAHCSEVGYILIQHISSILCRHVDGSPRVSTVCFSFRCKIENAKNKTVTYGLLKRKNEK